MMLSIALENAKNIPAWKILGTISFKTQIGIHNHLPTWTWTEYLSLKNVNFQCRPSNWYKLGFCNPLSQNHPKNERN